MTSPAPRKRPRRAKREAKCCPSGKVRTLHVPVGPEVAGFAVIMEAKLQMEGYDNAASWETIPIERLVRQLAVKVNRLATTTRENPDMLLVRAVVIGNLAMMVAEGAARALERATMPARASTDERARPHSPRARRS